RLESRGFTIIEVLIVLAVTGGLFVAAATMISGRQNQTAFDQAIRQIQAQIQQTIDDVAAGYYPNRANFQCTPGGPGLPPPLTSAASNQGTNSGCIFRGKALQFAVGTADPQQFVTYTIAGLQQGGASGAESANLTEAKPAIVAPGITHALPNYPDNS